MLSVIVCTHKRVDRLRASLASIGRTILPPEQRWELIVVDNRSLDGTDAAIAEFAARAAFPVHYVFEQQLGVSVARNTGIAASHGDIIAFTDDDCLVDPDWAAEIIGEFARDPSLLLLGGRVELHDPEDAPIGIRTSRERREMGGDLTQWEYLMGANIAMRRSVLRQVGGFDPRLGAGSGIVSSAEDTELFYRVLRLPGRVSYAPDVVVSHHHGRRNVATTQRNFEYAQGRGAIYAKHVLKGDVAMMRNVWWEMRTLYREIVRSPTAEDRAGYYAVIRGLLSGVAAFLFHAVGRKGSRPL